MAPSTKNSSESLLPITLASEKVPAGFYTLAHRSMSDLTTMSKVSCGICDRLSTKNFENAIIVYLLSLGGETTYLILSPSDLSTIRRMSFWIELQVLITVSGPRLMIRV